MRVSVVGILCAVLVSMWFRWWISVSEEGGMNNRSIGEMALYGLVEGFSSRRFTEEAIATVARSQDWEGKHVFVTGGNRGLGRAAAVHMAAMGADVVIACRYACAVDTLPMSK